jgi:hypothetical protein
VTPHLEDLVVTEQREGTGECWHDIEVPVDVSWSTGDGALAETRALTLQITDLKLVMFPPVDISPGTASAPRGTLTVTRTTPLVGNKPDWMTLSLSFTPQSSGGSITYWHVVYTAFTGGDGYATESVDIGSYSLSTPVPDAGGGE